MAVMPTIYNFAAGPGVLAADVLRQARDELEDWHGHGLSVLEMSHRSPEFTQIALQAEADLRELLLIPANYRVLFMPGGATAQFAAVPLNLAARRQSADYVITGHWSERACAEGRKYLDNIRLAATTEPHTYVPPWRDWQLSEDAAYLHVTPNETVHGVAFTDFPDTDCVPLVADVSSVLLSEPLDVRRFGVLYAGTQKNIGVAGLAVVIVREDLLGRPRPETPAVLHWTGMAAAGSMPNTPPTFSWYLAGLVLGWLKRQGGLAAIAELNQRKAARLYAAIDESCLYSNPVAPANRSRMNVVFSLATPELEAVFVKEARAAGLINLEGHRSAGGLRASLYNAMPEAGVDALIAFMKEFEHTHGPVHDQDLRRDFPGRARPL